MAESTGITNGGNSDNYKEASNLLTQAVGVLENVIIRRKLLGRVVQSPIKLIQG